MCLGVPGRIEEIRDERGTRMATVDFGGVTKTICLAYVPDADVGDYTIVHAGFAITRLDEESALETLRLMRDVGLLDEELGGVDTTMMGRAGGTTGTSGTGGGPPS